MAYKQHISAVNPLKRTIVVLAITFVAACTGPTVNTGPNTVPPAKNPAIAEVAPTGSLRVAVFTGNPLIGARQENGEVTGTTVTLGKALAAQLGVPVFIIEYTTIPKVVEGAASGAWDVTVLGVDAARRNAIDYAPAHLSVDLTYLVLANSKIRSAADADQPGVRVAAAKGGVPAIVLERLLTKGTLYEADNEAASLAALKAGRVQALAQNRTMLIKLSESLPGSRVIEDRFLAAELAFALPKGRPGALRYVSDFVEKAKKSGLVKESVEAAGLRGVNVAPGR